MAIRWKRWPRPEQILRRHVTGFWCARSDPARAIAWDELLRLSDAAALLREALPAGPWATPAAAIAWYTDRGWQVDGAGEEILRDLGKSPPELLALITPLRAAYRARWEHLMLAWSEVWAAAGYPVPALGTAGEWLQDLLAESPPHGHSRGRRLPLRPRRDPGRPPE